MKTQKTTLPMSLLVLILAENSLFAQAPQLINYQGKLNQGGAPANGTFSITFSVYAVESGAVSPLWTESQTVTATNGVFNVLLGSITSFPNDLFTASGDRYLGIKVDNDPEMTPRFRFASVAFAIRTANADTSIFAANADTAQVAREVLSIGPVPDGHSLDAEDGDPTDVVFVDSTGNVGIGTTEPGEKLSVSGILESTSGGFKFPGGTLQLEI